MKLYTYFAIANLASNVDAALQEALPFLGNGHLDLPVVNHKDMSFFRGGNDLGVRKHHSLIVTLGRVKVKAESLSCFEDLSIRI
jgi:hypothetical protein